MLIKNIWLSSVLSIAVVTAPDLFFSSVPALNKLEEQKIEKLVNSLLSNQSPTKSLPMSEQEAARYQMLMMRLIGVAGKYGAILSEAQDAEALLPNKQAATAKVKSSLLKLSNQIQQEPELTNLVKNLIVVACKHIVLIAEMAVASPYYAKIESGNMTEAEILALFADYVPKDLDIAQVLIEHSVLSYGYLKAQILAKQNLTLEDLAYVMQQLGVIAKLPAKGQEAWNDIVIAIFKGMNDLPADIRGYFIAQVEQTVRKPELDLGFKLLAGMAKLRQEVIKTKGVDQNKLIAYSKMLDQVIVQVAKGSNQVVATRNQVALPMSVLDSAMLVEKMIFTKNNLKK